MEAEDLMVMLEQVVTNGMPQLDAKYMALSLNAAVEGRRPSRELVSSAMRRILAMRDDPIRDYVFTSKTMAQVSVCCSGFQSVAARCSGLHPVHDCVFPSQMMVHILVAFARVPHSAIHCNTLQRTATHCNTLQQILAAFARVPRSWLDPEVTDTLCRVIINGDTISRKSARY